MHILIPSSYHEENTAKFQNDLYKTVIELRLPRVNVDGWTNGRTDERTETCTPSRLAKAGETKSQLLTA